jgi:hypothetical protein
LAWQAWNQAKALGLRPSELYGVTWPLAAFYLDRGLYWWSNFVESKMNEAEMTVRNQMKNQSGSDMFAQSSRTATYNKLMGLSVASAYRQPGLLKLNDESKAKSLVPQAKSASGEGNVDLTMFNG